MIKTKYIKIIIAICGTVFGVGGAELACPSRLQPKMKATYASSAINALRSFKHLCEKYLDTAFCRRRNQNPNTDLIQAVANILEDQKMTFGMPFVLQIQKLDPDGNRIVPPLTVACKAGLDQYFYIILSDEQKAQDPDLTEAFEDAQKRGFRLKSNNGTLYLLKNRLFSKPNRVTVEYGIERFEYTGEQQNLPEKMQKLTRQNLLLFWFTFCNCKEINIIVVDNINDDGFISATLNEKIKIIATKFSFLGPTFDVNITNIDDTEIVRFGSFLNFDKNGNIECMNGTIYKDGTFVKNEPVALV